jgi:hypothetical protein
MNFVLQANPQSGVMLHQLIALVLYLLWRVRWFAGVRTVENFQAQNRFPMKAVTNL